MWEKITEKLLEAESKQGWAKKTLFDWAKSKGTEHTNALVANGPEHQPGLGYKIAHKLVLRYVR